MDRFEADMLLSAFRHARDLRPTWSLVDLAGGFWGVGVEVPTSGGGVVQIQAFSQSYDGGSGVIVRGWADDDDAPLPAGVVDALLVNFRGVGPFSSSPESRVIESTDGGSTVWVVEVTPDSDHPSTVARVADHVADEVEYALAVEVTS